MDGKKNEQISPAEEYRHVFKLRTEESINKKYWGGNKQILFNKEQKET